MNAFYFHQKSHPTWQELRDFVCNVRFSLNLVFLLASCTCHSDLEGMQDVLKRLANFGVLKGAQYLTYRNSSFA